MADKVPWANLQKLAGATLKGKKNETGKPVAIGDVTALARAMRNGNRKTQKTILKKFAAANGVPAAAAAAAGAAVAAAADPKAAGSPKITSANKMAAKAAINAAIREAGHTRKIGMDGASRYAKLLKVGDKKGAKAYLKSIIEVAAGAGEKKAAEAAVKAAKKNIGMSNDAVAGIIRRNLGKGARPSNIAMFKKQIAEGKSQEAAVAAVKQMRKNAALKSAATKKKKGSNAGLMAAFNAAGKTGAAGAALVASPDSAKNALIEVVNASPNKFGRAAIGPGLYDPLLKTRNKRNYGTAAPGRPAAMYNVRGSPGTRRNRRNRRSTRRNTRRN